MVAILQKRLPAQTVQAWRGSARAKQGLRDAYPSCLLKTREQLKQSASGHALFLGKRQAEESGDRTC
jgi:hypothetical protein